MKSHTWQTILFGAAGLTSELPTAPARTRRITARTHRIAITVMRVLLMIVLLTGTGYQFLSTPQPAYAVGEAAAQTFFLSMPEDQVRTAFGVIDVSGGNFSDSMVSITSIAVTVNNTIIYYDQWEDGYEAASTTPVQASTLVFGDGNTANGNACTYAATLCSGDVLTAGAVLVLRNNVPSTPPRGTATYFDARDKLATTQLVAVTRAMWDSGIGTVLAGALQVYDTTGYGTDFRLPAGENLAAASSAMFEYAGLYIMAANAGTTVNIDSDGNGSTDYTTTLGAGQAYLLSSATLGVTLNSNARITSSLPIQVNLITGDINSQQKYENRWFNIPPLSLLGPSYVTPVSSMSNSNSNVFIYNPSQTSSITVYAQTSSGTTNFTVAAGATYRYVMPTGSGARFYTTNSAPFMAIGTNDSPAVGDSGASAGSTWDWGYTLVAEDQLAPMLAVGWAPGSNAVPPANNGSPVWVSAAAATTVYVDYDGNPATGPNIDPNGSHYNVSFSVTALQSIRIYDPDNDQTGMRVYTVDGTLLTAAWGEDTSTAGTGNPYLDMGYVVFPLPQMSVTKTGVLDVSFTAPLDKANPGDKINYTIIASNTGTRILHNVTVVDAKLGTLSCTPAAPVASLAAGASVVCTGSYILTQADIDAGVVYNTANGDSNETPLITVQEDVPIPLVSVSKTAAPTSVPETGGNVTFTFTVTNSSPVETFKIMSLTDSIYGTLAGDADCQVGTVLPVLSSCNFTITRAVTGDYPGSHTNLFTVVGSDSKGNLITASDSETVTITDVVPLIDIVKYVSVDGGATWADANTAPGPFLQSGTNPRFKFVVTNTGAVALGSLTLSDPSFAAFYQSNLTTPCAIPATLAPAASFTCYASSAWAAGQHTNTAAAAGSFTDSVGNVETGTDTDSANYFGAVPTLSLTKSASPTTYSAVGESISYTYALKNTGNVTLTSPFAVSDDKLTVTCPPASSLAPSATLACTASHTITQADLDAGSIVNHASGTAKFGDATVTSNQATATVTAEQSPALSLTKSADPSTYDTVGQTISYSYLVTNSGNVTLNGPFAVTDTKAAVTCPATASLTPGASITCSASYIVTQADLDASKVTNHATASNGTVTSNEATVSVYAVAHPNLSLVKTAAPATYDHLGQTISYSYAVKNIGNVALRAPFAVADDKATVTCPQTPDPLPVGSTITCTASYAVTQADLDAGSLTNHAKASAVFGGNPVISNEAQATVNAEQKPALAIDKTATETTYAAVGNVIHYSYKVTNAGNVTLHDAITVSDNKAVVTCPDLPLDGLAPGAFITCSATYTIQQSDLDAGSLTNVASATSGTTTSPTDTVTVPATQSPALTLVKSASPATYNTAGETISYTYDLTNTGNVTLSGPFTVNDDQATVTCPAVPSLAPGDTLTCSASHIVTQAEVDGGSITNVARGHAFFGTTPVDSNQDTKTVTAVKAPALTIVKTATPTTYDSVGAVISYSYLVTNSGNVTLYNLSVVDDKAAVTCPDTSVGLAPHGAITCFASYTIAQADLDGGSVTNSAYATDGRTSSTPDSETVNAIQQGGLGLAKSATPGTYSKVGDIISYSYVVKNTGNITLAGPFTVNDNVVGAVSCPTGSLAPAATVTCTASYAITQADLDAGSLTNIATATDGKLTSNEATATVAALQTPALAIDKIAQESTYAQAGNVIHYSYTVTNAGNVTLHAPITVSDDKATDESCPDLPAGGLAPGASITCTASYTIMQSDLDAGSLTNVASATDGSVTSPTDTVTVPAAQRPALTLRKSANPLTYTTVGQTITYDYLLTNSGNVTLSGPFAVSDDKAPVTCPAAVTSLAPGGTLNCTASYSITQADLNSGSVTNTATATAKFGDATVTSNQDTATVNAVQNPALTLVKSAAPSTYDHVGAVIHYSYVVTNSGNVTLSGPFTVADDKASDESCPTAASLAPGASITCTASYTITQADLDAGSVTNTAKAKGLFGGKDVFSNEDSQTVHAVPTPDLSLVKSANPVTYDHVGQIIGYSYALRNIGNVTLAGPFTVTDDKTSVTCPTDATLAVNAEITCSATYTITQADLDAGFVTNIATGHAQTLGGTPVNSNNASATVNADKQPALAIDKSVQETAFAHVGDLLHYRYLVTNTGNVTLHDAIVVSDDKATDESCPALPVGGLAPGASITCTASYTITQADLDAGSVTNVASAASGTTVSPTDTETVSATQSPHLRLSKEAAEANFSAAGVTLHYTLIAANDGNVTLTGVSISDPKLGALDCSPLQPATLAPAATLTCTGTYVTTQADVNAGKVDNTAYAGGTFGTTAVNALPASETVPGLRNPHLSLSKAVDETIFNAAGMTLHYVLIAVNDGNVTLTGVSISDPKLGALTCSPLQPAVLAPAATLTCTGTYVTTQADVDAGKVDNTAQASGLFGPTPVASDPANAHVPAYQTPHLRLSKVAMEANFNAAGVTLNYTLTATNDGNVTLTGVSISDAKLGALTCTPAQPAILAPLATLTCAGTYVTTQADMDAGKVDNTANASGLFGTAPVEALPASASVPAVQSPALTLVKTATPSTYAAVGEVIHYSYVVKNTGNVTLAGPVTVADNKVTVTCLAGGLVPGASLTCTATYTITQTDLDAGSVKNTAKASANGTDSNTADATVNAVKNPALSLVKTASPATYSKVGDVISYSYVVKNTGNVTLAGPVTVTDDKATVTCPAGGLVPGASLTCTASYTITQTDLDNGSVTNTAKASANGTDSNPDSETVNAVQNPALSLVKTAAPSTYSTVGQTISYSYVVKNTGNVTLAGPVTVADNKATVTCPAGGLAPLASLTCTATYTITQTDLDAGSVTNTAKASANGTDSNPDSETVTAVQSPALSLVKSATPSTYAAVGEVIHYSYVVKNTGNVTLAGPVTVADNKATVTCPAGGLAPGASMTCTASYTITQTDLDAGSVTNTAKAKVVFGGKDVFSNEDSETVTAEPKPALSLVKSATPSTYSTVGQTISYSYVVKNTGNVTLAGPVTVADNKATVTCPAGGLAPGASLTCTATYTITQTDLDTGSVTNTAKAKVVFGGKDVFSNEDSETVTAEPKPALSLMKTATPSTYSTVGQTISYSYKVTNAGNVTLHDPISVTDDKAAVTCGPLPPAGLVPGEFITCTASYTITQTDLDAGSVINKATAATQYGGKPVNSNEASATVTALQNPAISLTKSATPSTYSTVGQTINYSYVVKNTGNVTLHDAITVADNKVTVTCPALPVGGLVPDASITCTATYTIKQADLDAGSVTNTAKAATQYGGKPVTSNEATATVTALQNPAISLTKATTTTSFDHVGQMINYTLTAKNTGNVILVAVSITDPKLGTLTCGQPAILSPGATLTCTGSHTVTQADLDAGKYDNTAAVNGKGPQNQSVSDTASASVPAIQSPALSLTKSASPATYSAVGQVISYSYVLKNTGNVTLSGPFTVTDNKATVACTQPSDGKLSPNETMTCKATYKVTQADLDAGSVTNKATASNGTVTSNEDTATVNAVQNPLIALTKTADPTVYDHAGQVIAYTLVATNTGNVTLHDVSINDPKLGTLTCTPAQPAILAPGAKLTCSGTYTIQAADMLVGQLVKVMNTATVTGKGPQNQPVDATASATVYKQTGALLPTQTTCQQYAAGPSAWPAMYANFSYGVKSGKINSVSPGVIFYYNTISAPSASFTIQVVETNTKGWKPMLVQQELKQSQAILYDASCSKVSGVTVTSSGTTTYTTKFTVTGATPGATYYIGIKYSPQNLVGQSVTATGGKYPTSVYSFSTTGQINSATSIPVMPK